MGKTGWLIAAALTMPLSMAACGGNEKPAPAEGGAPAPAESGAPAETPSSTADPLVGTWSTVLTPELEEQAAKKEGVEDGFVRHEDLFYGEGPATIVLTFENGRMVHTSEVEGMQPEVGWSGVYEIVDEDTFIAGDSGDLYIEYEFSIDGDQLLIDMVKNDYPAVSEEALAGEIYAQTVIYESAPFTREA